MTTRVQGVTGPTRTANTPLPRTPALRSVPVLFVGDLRAMLHALKISDREDNAKRAEAGVTVSHVARQEATEKMRSAEAEAKAAEDSKSFWSDVASVASTVATVAAVAAAVASVVFTGGASAVAIVALAGTLLSAGSPLIAKAAGDDAGKVALYGGMALSIGASAYSALGKTAAVQGAKALAQSSAAATSPTTSAVGAGTTMGARGAEGSARVAEGYAKYRAGDADASVTRARADEMSARQAVRRSQTSVEDVVALLRDMEASVSRALQTIGKIGDTVQAAQDAVAKNIGGRELWA